MLVVLLDQLVSLFQESLLLAKFVVVVSHLFLAVLDVNLFTLDLSDESFPDVRFQLKALLIPQTHCIFDFCLFGLQFNLDESVPGGALLVLLVKVLLLLTQFLLSATLIGLKGLLLFDGGLLGQLSVLSETGNFLVLNLLQFKKLVFLLLEFTFLILELLLLDL